MFITESRQADAAAFSKSKSHFSHSATFRVCKCAIKDTEETAPRCPY